MPLLVVGLRLSCLSSSVCLVSQLRYSYAPVASLLRYWVALSFDSLPTGCLTLRCLLALTWVVLHMEVLLESLLVVVDGH